MNTTLLEIIKLIISLLTPLIVLIVGLLITKKIEKNKIEILKEKEWQVRWAELFLQQATDFNNNITIVVCSLFILQSEKDPNKISEINKKILNSNYYISEINWNIQNYVQFSLVHKENVIKTQQKLMELISQLISMKLGNFEVIRKLQFEYNDAVKKAHNEILKLK